MRRNREGLKWGEGTIEARPRGDQVFFMARWLEHDLGSTKRRSKQFATRAEAEDHLRGVLRAKQDGRYAAPLQMTVSELVADYVDRAAEAGRITSRTALTYRKRATSMIEPTIGKRRLEALTPLDVQRWIDGLTRAKFAPSTIHAAVAVLMGALREAALLGITDRHLGQGIRRPAIGRPHADTWSAEDVRLVVKAVKDDPIYGALYRVAIATGLRPGELRALKWVDINLQTGILTVRRTASKDEEGREILVERTKSKSVRAVALSAPVVDALKRHKVQQAERRLRAETWHDLGLVFDRGDGHWLYQSQWQRFQKSLCARIGVPYIRHHDLRHTSATLELETGTHPKVVADRLGHATIAMTLDRYSHVSAALQRQAADVLAARLFGDEEEDTADAG